MHPAKKKTSKKEKVIINVFVKSSLLEKGKRVDTDIDYKVPKEEVARRERGRGRSRPERQHWAKKASMSWLIFLFLILLSNKNTNLRFL